MYIKNIKDFYAGLVFLLFGIPALILSKGYQMGTSAKMGPGYFPFLLGGLLTVLGLVILLRSVSKKEGTGNILSFHGKPAFLVLSSVVLFGLFLRPLGLLLATVLLVIVSSKASFEFKMKEALLNALVLLTIVLIIFIYLLKFQIPVWPSFLAGRT